MVSCASDGNIDVRIFFACYLILISHLGCRHGFYCLVWIVESTFIKVLVLRLNSKIRFPTKYCSQVSQWKTCVIHKLVRIFVSFLHF